MSSKNIIDFVPKTESYIPHFCRPVEDDEIRQGNRLSEIINSIVRAKELRNFNGFVVGFVTFAYMRIIGTTADNKLHIPVKASFDTLKYNEGQNFFIDIFNRYKIICEANALLDETASILEPSFMAGAENLPIKFQEDVARELLEIDWSKRGFDNQDCSFYVKDILIWENIVYDDSPTAYQDFYKELHHLTPLLNIQSEEKQLCTPILYITYLVNIFEQLVWPKNSCEKLVKKYLDNVTTVQTNRVLWAIHTLEVVLIGCNKQLISKAGDLATIHNKVNNKVDDGFDVIFLPETSQESIPDIGTITIGDIDITKVEEDWYSSDLYFVAFLYNLLNDHGRMFIRFDKEAEKSLRREEFYDHPNQAGNLLAFFVDNNLIEAMLQTKNCTYMLIDKNRPETKHGRVLFYYIQDLEYIPECYFPENEKLATSIKEYSCENIQIKHDEGACIVSNQEIRLNDYCLLPKKYIYDFDRITANAEFQVVRHIAHDLSPKLYNVDSVLKHLTRFIESHELLQEPLQERFYEGQPLEPVGEAIDKARSDISQMHKLIKDTRKVITEEIPLEEFSSVNLRDFLEATKKKYATGNITLDIDCDHDIQYEMHKTSFAEMIDNFVRNAEIHGFVNGGKRTDCKIAIVVAKRKNDPNLIVEIKNNGNPLPDELTVEKFIDFGSKGNNSSGDGLGGAYIHKVIRAHRGNLEIIRDDKKYPVNFKITLPNPEVSK